MDRHRQICRVLKPEGVFLSITFAQPHFRRPFFSAEDYDWSFRYSTFGETFHYFVYFLQRGNNSNTDTSSEHYEPSRFALHGGTVHEHMDDEDFLMHIEEGIAGR